VSPPVSVAYGPRIMLMPLLSLNFPDENHWVLRPENSLAWHKEVLGWINRWSGVKGTV